MSPALRAGMRPNRTPGWALNLDPARRAKLASRLTRKFLECIELPADRFHNPELTIEAVAAAFRRGLEVVAEVQASYPDPADQSPAAKVARDAWFRAVVREVRRLDNRSRVPLAKPRKP